MGDTEFKEGSHSGHTVTQILGVGKNLLNQLSIYLHMSSLICLAPNKLVSMPTGISCMHLSDVSNIDS
jgi:hypothetical protein